MELDYEKRRLLVSEGVRIILTIFVLYVLNIPIFLKILLIMVFDKLDCSHMSYPFTGPLFSNNVEICKTMEYQKSDKITDSICYIILWIYLLNHGGLAIHYNYLISYLLVYRLLGTYLFLTNNDRNFLFYFPNFFLEISLGLMVMNQFPILQNFERIIILTIIISKIIVEYYLHVFTPLNISNTD